MFAHLRLQVSFCNAGCMEKTRRQKASKRALAILVTVLAWSAFAASAIVHAQDNYPSNTIRLITGFPSGILDVIARLLAQKLAAQMDARAIVENRPGFNGNIAAEYVAK